MKNFFKRFLKESIAVDIKTKFQILFRIYLNKHFVPPIVFIFITTTFLCLRFYFGPMWVKGNHIARF